MLTFVRLALRHHAIAAIVGFVLTLLVTFLASQVVGDLYAVEATVYVAEPVAVHRLANPFAPVPQSKKELTDVPELLQSRDSLVSIVKRSGLLDQWEQGRPEILKWKDQVLEKIRGPIDEKERLDALVSMLEKRLDVQVDGQKVKLLAEWSSPDVAVLLVKTQIGALMQLRSKREGKTLDDAAQALDEQLSGLKAEMTQRVQKIERATLDPNGWATIEVESEQLFRDQSRAADLMVQAEEKHIGAEVFSRSNSLRFTVVAPPVKPRLANGLPRSARVLMALIAAALMAVLCAATLGLASGRVLSGAQLENELGLRVVANLQVPHGGLIVHAPRWAWALALGLAVMAGAAGGLTHGNPVPSLVVPLGVTGAWLVWTRPLKWPLLLIFLLGVTLDDPTDRPYVGLWHSPFWALGRIFHTNIALFTGFELALAGLSVVLVARRLFMPPERRALLDPPLAFPRPLLAGVVLSFLTIGWLVVMGVGRGGVFREALWQFRYLLFLPVSALLAIYALDLPKDLPKLLAVLIVGSVVKALLGTFFMYGIAFPMGEYPPHTTGHNDTMIFVVAVVTALILFFEKPSRRHLWLIVLWMPFVGVALKLNDRRIAYVDIVMALGIIYLLSPMHVMKRRITRFGVAMLPVLALYMAAGWNSHSGVFGPVQKVRSIIAPAEDTEEESSNVERDIENFNLMKSWERNMLFGQGFGHAFTEFLPSNDFRQSNFGHVGHNSILWVLWIGGVFGFTGVLLWVAIALFFLGRTLPRTDDWRERTALYVSLAAIVTYLMQAFGDMGTQSIMFTFFTGVAVATIGRLAMKHGAWAIEDDSRPTMRVTKPAPAAGNVTPTPVGA
ncbi:MAG: hypothetical protein U0228_36445 [Myxococcaceae bacterium]